MAMVPKMLIIDDEPLMRITLQDSLVGEGYEVVAAETGRKGVDLLRKNQWDIIITDLKLPDLEGIEILKEAKSLNPSTEVILITAYGPIDSAVSAMKEGASDYPSCSYRSLGMLRSISSSSSLGMVGLAYSIA